MNLLLDSGNTYTKMAVANSDEILEIKKISSIKDLEILRETYHPEYLIISSVNKSAKEMTEAFPSVKKAILLNHTTALPIENKYGTPESLGVDRLAVVVGANAVFPEEDCLVIDAGTCITYDYITRKGEYMGGGISPGMEMRFKALNTFTAKLPLIEKEEVVSLIGNSTKGSILSGVILGCISEIEGIINLYQEKSEGIKIIITGGDAAFFESKIKQTIFVVPDLLFKGLNRILKYNVS